MKKMLIFFACILLVIGNINSTPDIPARNFPVQTFNAIVLPTGKKGDDRAEKSQLKKEFKKFKKEYSKAKSPGKSKTLAVILALFVGNLGIHRFYMGQKAQGFAQLGGTVAGLALYIIGVADYVSGEGENFPTLAVIGLALMFIVSIWAFVDFIRILTGGLEPEEGFDS